MLRKIVAKLYMSIFDPVREARSAVKDIPRLGRDIPELADYPRLYEAAKMRLAESHAFYVSRVSTGTGSAASLELACFLDIWCRTRNPRFILDLGSGYSSFIFRSYQKDADHPVRVISVDNSPEWLAKTGEYLRNHGLSEEELMLSGALPATDFTGVDLVLFDIRPLDARTALLGPVCRAMPVGGGMVIDDVHKPHFRPFVRRELAKLPCTLYNLQAVTLDSYSRYAYLAVK
jgi:predicted O-methyltransferase YrrM